jgi:putative protease
MIEHIPDIVGAGIDSLKVEGRMKTALYVAAVARTYRQALDDYYTSPELYESRKPYYMDEISKCTYRQYTTGFFYGKPTHEAQIYDSNTYIQKYTYLGTVREVTEDGYAVIEQKNKFAVGDRVELMSPSGSDQQVEVLAMRDEQGISIESCPHPQQRIEVKFPKTPEVYDIIRVKCD